MFLPLYDSSSFWPIWIRWSQFFLPGCTCPHIFWSDSLATLALWWFFKKLLIFTLPSFHLFQGQDWWSPDYMLEQKPKVTHPSWTSWGLIELRAFSLAKLRVKLGIAAGSQSVSTIRQRTSSVHLYTRLRVYFRYLTVWLQFFFTLITWLKISRSLNPQNYCSVKLKNCKRGPIQETSQSVYLYFKSRPLSSPPATHPSSWLRQSSKGACLCH